MRKHRYTIGSSYRPCPGNAVYDKLMAEFGAPRQESARVVRWEALPIVADFEAQLDQWWEYVIFEPRSSEAELWLLANAEPEVELVDYHMYEVCYLLDSPDHPLIAELCTLDPGKRSPYDFDSGFVARFWGEVDLILFRDYDQEAWQLIAFQDSWKQRIEACLRTCNLPEASLPARVPYPRV